MVLEELKKFLDKYKVNRDFSQEIKEGYRHPLEKDLNLFYDENPNYRYGGSLAKGTANCNSCDIDLLCYFSGDYNRKLEDIYNETYDALLKSNYILERKNSAICVKGTSKEGLWDISVDIVPGKYTSNDNNKDVFLWCNKDKCRLKSNPELQIKKVKESESKDLIRLVKLYKEFNNFKFKSFYLEIFAIDIVEPEYVDGDNLYDKLIKFCKHYDDIGNVKIYDPANSTNDITKIHSDQEFLIIRNKIKRLYNALLTNDEETIINCIKNKPYDIEKGFLNNAKAHFENKGGISNPLINYFSFIHIKGFYKVNDVLLPFDSNTYLKKEYELKFEISLAQNLQKGSEVKLIVSNSGYEALKDNCLRGKSEDTKIEVRSNNRYYYRYEMTRYYGNHCVQAYVKLSNKEIFYSDILVVKVR